MNSVLRRAVTAVIALTVLGAATLVSGEFARVHAAEWAVGDVFVGVSNGQYKVFSNAGTEKETISAPDLSGFTTGCAFDASSNLYTTYFTAEKVVKFAGVHPHAVLQVVDVGVLVNDPNEQPESIVFAKNGDFYVGRAGGDKFVRRYNAAGVFQQAYTVETTGGCEVCGSDQVELAGDQKTLFYTNEGRRIYRFDVTGNEGAGAQLPDFAVLPTETGAEAFALRLLPPGDGSGGLLVADKINIKRLNASGAVIQTYDVVNEFVNENTWFSMNLDPNGTSFWAGNHATSNFYRFNIATGDVEVGPVNTLTPASTVFGICVKGEPTAAAPPAIVTVADNLSSPYEAAAGTDIYIAETGAHRILKVDAEGVKTTVVGSGVAGFLDGSAATALLNRPTGLAVERNDSGTVTGLLFADSGNHVIRRWNAATGNVTTVAGTPMSCGVPGNDGQLATAARFCSPEAVALAGGGSFIVADTNNQMLRKVAPRLSDGALVVTRIAGVGVGGLSGDGGPATSAHLAKPTDVVVAGANIYFTDQLNHRVRMINSDGMINTVAGSGTVALAPFVPEPGEDQPAPPDPNEATIGASGCTGDGGPATSARLNFPYGLAVDENGNIFIADFNNHRVRRVDGEGIITTIIGTGTPGNGEGQLNSPRGLDVTTGRLVIADTGNGRVLEAPIDQELSGTQCAPVIL